MTEPPGPPPKATSRARFPPPFLYVGFLLVGLLLERWAPLVRLPRAPSRALAAVLLLAGLGLLLGSFLLFLHARTSPSPLQPTAALVAAGPYRWMRNPMYLAMLLVYLGTSLLFDLFWALLLAPLVVFLMNRIVIAREERYLEGRFGDEYRRYRTRVRRWI